MTGDRFAPDDRVYICRMGSHKNSTTWIVVGRDYWWADTQPAYKLQRCLSDRIEYRYAFESDLTATGRETQGVV